MAVAYVDSSAIVKLVREEDGSAELATFLESCEVVTSEIAIVETMRALQRYAALHDPSLDGERIEVLAVGALEDVFLVVGQLRTHLRAGRYPGLIRSLDAMHVAAAEEVGVVDVFVTYDERQAAVARLAGLRTVAPGA